MYAVLIYFRLDFVSATQVRKPLIFRYLKDFPSYRFITDLINIFFLGIAFAGVQVLARKTVVPLRSPVFFLSGVLS
jgi:hypothetical protein